MANNYLGYLLKIKGTSGQYASDYTFPLEYIQFETFKPLKSIQDKDSYRDGDGELHRTVVPAKIVKVEFQLRENLTATEYCSIMSNISGRYTKADERKCQIDVYLPETAVYTGAIDVYLPDPEVVIKRADNNDFELIYKSVRMAFIGYGSTTV